MSDSDLFDGTADYYLRYRSSYPAALVARVIQLTRLDPGSRVLDLGSGPGILAQAFASACAGVTCVDPAPEMIRAARANLLELGDKAHFVCARADQLTDAIGRFGLVTIGRAFHWMDRDATLALLDRIVERDGAVVLFRDPVLRLPETEWRAAFDDIFAAFASSEAARAGAERTRFAENERHLLRSPFAHLERVSTIVSRSLTVDDLIGRAFSMAGTSPRDLGDRRTAFEAAMRAALAPYATDGRVTETTEPQTLIARRSPSTNNA